MLDRFFDGGPTVHSIGEEYIGYLADELGVRKLSSFPGRPSIEGIVDQCEIAFGIIISGANNTFRGIKEKSSASHGRGKIKDPAPMLSQYRLAKNGDHKKEQYGEGLSQYFTTIPCVVAVPLAER